MKKTVSLDAIARLVAPRERADLVGAIYDAETQALVIEWADLPPRPVLLLESDVNYSVAQMDALRERADELYGDKYDIVLLAGGLKGTFIPASALKAD